MSDVTPIACIGVNPNVIMFVDKVAFAGAVIVPSLFMCAIVLRTLDGLFSHSSCPQGHLSIKKNSGHAEPIVLVVLGSVFIFANYKYFQTFSTAMLYLVGPVLVKPEARDEFYIYVSITSVAVTMTLAKAFWTHILLENNQWGHLIGYRNALERYGAPYVVLELCLRCAIAALVILMQHAFGNLAHIAHIHDVSSTGCISADTGDPFLYAFSRWLANYTRLGWWLYVTILIWVPICAFPQSRQGGNWQSAVRGTLFAMLPAFFIVYWMYNIATGEWFPDPSVVISLPPDDGGEHGGVVTMLRANAGHITMWASTLCGVSLFIIGNIIFTLWDQTQVYFRTAPRAAYGLLRTSWNYVQQLQWPWRRRRSGV